MKDISYQDIARGFTQAAWRIGSSSEVHSIYGVLGSHILQPPSLSSLTPRERAKQILHHWDQAAEGEHITLNLEPRTSGHHLFERFERFQRPILTAFDVCSVCQCLCSLKKAQGWSISSKKSQGFCLSRQGQQGQRYPIHQDSSSPKDSGPCLEKSSQKASTEFVVQSRPRRQAATTLGAKRCWKLHQCHLVM